MNLPLIPRDVWPTKGDVIAVLGVCGCVLFLAWVVLWLMPNANGGPW